MIVVLADGTELVPARTERRVTRLARDFYPARELTPAARERTIGALSEYLEIMRGFGVSKVACGATGVVRLARNSAELIEEVKHGTGITVAVLSEEEEAFLSAKGMLSVLPEFRGDFLSFDIGGGSTEFLLAGPSKGGPVWSTSIPVGAAVLTEAFLANDPPGVEAVSRAAFSVRERLEGVGQQVRGVLSPSLLDEFSLAGTAGTVTTLAAMFLEMDEYVPYRVNGLELERRWLSDAIRALAGMSLEKRRGIRGLEPGREDIILGGAVIVDEILACFGRTRFTVTDAGLLEGILLDLAEKDMGLPSGLTTRLTWRLQKG